MNPERRTHRFFRPLAIGVLAAAAATAVWMPAGGYPEPDAEAYPVRGIDISAHNGPIEFGRVADSGIEFAYIKATEGATFKDARFTVNHHEARQAGIATGAYHFFRFEVDGTLQAVNLINSIQDLDLQLPPAIDLEEWTNPGDIPTETVLANLGDMVIHLRRSGYSPVIYTNKDGHSRFFAAESGSGVSGDMPLWICSFTDPPVKAPWLLWQYHHRGRVDGISGVVDLNVFNGSRSEWEQWLAMQ